MNLRNAARFAAQMGVVGRLLPWFVLILCFAGPAGAQDVQPNAPESHKAFLKLLEASRTRARHDIIARYDALLASASSDHLTAIERCMFIAQSLGEDEDDPEPSGQSCTDELESRYGQEPAVVLYLLGTKWGDNAVEYGTKKLADPSIPF